MEVRERGQTQIVPVNNAGAGVWHTCGECNTVTFYVGLIYVLLSPYPGGKREKALVRECPGCGIFAAIND